MRQLILILTVAFVFLTVATVNVVPFCIASALIGYFLYSRSSRPEPEQIITQGDYLRLGYRFDEIDQADLDKGLTIMIEEGCETAPLTCNQYWNICQLPQWKDARKKGTMIVPMPPSITTDGAHTTETRRAAARIAAEDVV